MREPLAPYRGVDAVNYLCLVAMDLLGQKSLRGLPPLLSGFESVLATLPPAAARALRNLRLAGCAPTTLRDLRLMVEAYRRHHERRERERRAARDTTRTSTDGAARFSANGGTRRSADVANRGEDTEERGFEARFKISDDLSVEKRWNQLVPDDIREALQSLTNRMPPRTRPRVPSHDPGRAAEIRNKASGFEARVQALGFVPPPTPMFDLGRRPQALAPIRWDELVAIADRFDAMDVASSRQREGERSWYYRLHDETDERRVILYKTDRDGLVATDVLDLSGIRHLIGLPGAGKTTLLYLLAAHVQERGYRACFLFPSIEVSTGFVEKLHQYDVGAALVFGQSESARHRHVANFGASLSGLNKGLGVKRSVALSFSTNCALAAFASAEEEEFPHEDPPCRVLEQERTKDNRRGGAQCALASVCGRQFAERELVGASIWVGHVLSTDRRLSGLFSETEITYFELIARTFDLLVVDECDGTQSTLDERGTPLMKLSGDDSSVWSRLIEDLHGRAARGRNAFVSRTQIPTMLEMTGRFGRAAERLTARVMHFRDDFRKTHDRMLLTTVSIIADLFEAQDEAGPKDYGAQDALEKIWDLAAKRVAFRSRVPAEVDEAEEDPETPTDRDRALQEAAELAAVDIESMRAFYDALLGAIEEWDLDGTEGALREVAAVLRAAPGLRSNHDDVRFLEYTGLLTTVSLLVLQHFGLAPHLRMLNAQGLIGADVFEQRPSRDALALLPETLVGRLSGVRYMLSDEGDVDISHIGFVGTPRLLAQRMHELGLEDGEGPAVLLTSATSMLEQSPSFHINVGPHYVLNRPRAEGGWAGSKYRFLPQLDPRDDKRYLRFSGSRMSQRERILKAMVEQLFRGGALGDVEAALRSNDVVDGIGRKVGFVLNSYEQCRIVFDYIMAQSPQWRGRVRYLVRPAPHGSVPEFGLTASEVEVLGTDRNWDLLIFPMTAIGRGVNLVYRFGPRVDQAMLGSLFFLTRPHPRMDSLQLLQGLIGRASEEFDQAQFGSTAQALEHLRQARNRESRAIKHLLRLPLSAQRLGEHAKAFVADQMIMILQTIGRAMRGDCPAFVYFVDEAWAPRSAREERDTERSSMLVMMRRIMRECLNHPNAARRQCYENLYTSFSIPLERMEGLIE